METFQSRMSKASQAEFSREALKGFVAKTDVPVRVRRVGVLRAGARPLLVRRVFLLLSVVAFANCVPQGIAGACQKRFSEIGAADRELLEIVVTTAAAAGVLATAISYLSRDFLVSYTGLAAAPVLAPLLLVSMALYIPLPILLCSQGRFGDKEWVELVRDVSERHGGWEP